MKSEGMNEHTIEHVIQQGEKVTVSKRNNPINPRYDDVFQIRNAKHQWITLENQNRNVARLLKKPRHIVFLQEVTNHALQDLYGYNMYLNVGTDMRGTAFVTKQDLQITNINKRPSGRGMKADFRGVKLINIYAPSGTAKKREREQFYSSEITILFQNI